MSKIKRSIKPKLTKGHDVSVVIVCRNGKAVTEQCLKGICSLPVKEIIVVDNNSTDGTKELLRQFAKRDKRAHIIRNSKNNGFAEANNQGYELSTGKFILFLNNDTIIEKDFLPFLLKTLETKKIAAVQPMILFPDKTIDSVGSFLTPTGFLYHRAHRLIPKRSFLKHEPVYTMKGACMLWKREVLVKIGVFDESYFAYFEETELCHRALNAGYQVFVNPAAQIIHLGGFTSNTIQANFIQYHNTKNRISTFCIHLPLSDLFCILPLHLALTEALIIKTLFSATFNLAWSIQKGLVVGLLIGFKKRLRTFFNHRVSLDQYIKHPDLAYYKALFSSLEGYSKIC